MNKKKSKSAKKKKSKKRTKKTNNSKVSKSPNNSKKSKTKPRKKSSKKSKDITPKPGDRVEIHLAKIIYEGILLESPESEQGIVLLKLDSGYNIGFKKKDVFDVKLLEQFKEEKQELELKKEKGKPNIAMIITGGTIAARLNPKKGGVDWLTSPENLLKYYPGVFDKVNVVKVKVPFMKASEDMDYKDWKKIARVSEKLLNDSNIKGIIITHGTDFLHYTSAALSFFLNATSKLNKPVVLTYSQRSIDRASSDANLNLRCAALAASSDIAEVMLVGHSSSNDDYCLAMPGTKVRKLHTSKRDAFKIVNGKAFARIYPDKLIKESEYNVKNTSKCKTDLKFDGRVALVKIYPGQEPSILDYYVKNKYKGLVLEMSGLGHAPTKRARKGWTNKLKDIQKKGVIVCAAAQTVHGRLDPLVYSNGRELLETGIIYLEDMLAETALVKLGWVLGHEEWTNNKQDIKEKMLDNFSREFSDRLEK
ncbi:Glu-tRNA(Gln) amidotransferase subunit GatD [Candidatus Pacearchaeota archaeon]|nr:Glu-tRNA(Gln) amidotransferase subunit GatD [Candidatus Pacearchaeota archaeon]